MEKFLGVLFCGGKGTRLGEISRYVSKPFLPIYDRPALKFGLALLENSRYVDEIVILTNSENDNQARGLGYPTLIQDDTRVTDMISGWQYVKEKTGTQSHGILVPGDNISDVHVDLLIDLFRDQKAEFVFSLYTIADRYKLSQMGCYDPVTGKMYYKNPNPSTDLGMIAPFVIHNQVEETDTKKIVDERRVATHRHRGYWFDIGDVDSLVEASQYIRALHEEQFVVFM